MKEGKGNTFSTSLNKSFFYSSLILSLSFVFTENRSIAIEPSRNDKKNIEEKSFNKRGRGRERWAHRRANERIDILRCMCVCAIAHAMLIDIHVVVVRRVTKWKMILLTRHKTMNENERIKENVQCDVQLYPLH